MEKSEKSHKRIQIFKCKTILVPSFRLGASCVLFIASMEQENDGKSFLVLINECPGDTLCFIYSSRMLYTSFHSLDRLNKPEASSFIIPCGIVRKILKIITKVQPGSRSAVVAWVAGDRKDEEKMGQNHKTKPPLPAGHFRQIMSL